MNQGKKILALVPARGGSKRLPGKNIRLLGGKPLINWTIDIAKESELFCDILVSTDCSEIAIVAEKCGALVPWLRPDELSNDVASSVNVAIHALNWYEATFGLVDGVCLLQPTSPFRSTSDISGAVSLFFENGKNAVVSVGLSDFHPAWCFYNRNNTLVPILDWVEVNKRSQDLEPAYVLNGSIYIISPADLRSEHTFLTKKTTPFILNEKAASLDIDTSEDWLKAESYLISSPS